MHIFTSPVRTSLLACAGLMLATAPASAGDLVIGGIIFSDLDAPIFSGVNDVTVTVSGAGGPLQTTTQTIGVPGLWSITGLEEGLYTIEAELTGWCFNVRLLGNRAPGGPPPLTVYVSQDRQGSNGNIQMLATETPDPGTCENGLCTDDFACAGPCVSGVCVPDDPRAAKNGCVESCALGALCDGGVCGPACTCMPLPTCTTFSDCADLDSDAVRDNPCVWWDCVDGTCNGLPIRFADLGGQFGACVPDGTVDGNDRFQALNCFANQGTVPGTPYECEAAAPAAFRADAGGEFGTCFPDGVCDGNETFLTLNSFGGTATCACPEDGGLPGPAPAVQAPTRLQWIPNRATIQPNEVIAIDVLLPQRIALVGYQLQVQVHGGLRGVVEVVDIAVTPPDDKPRPTWLAFNRALAMVVAGVDFGAKPQAQGCYLATLVLRAGAQASGTFVVDLTAASRLFTRDAVGGIQSPGPVCVITVRR